ncbi:MAG: hypothetical protein ACK4UN_15235, partial [Limisphaerales bacterium]
MQSTGESTFNDDGTMISKTENLMVIRVPEGRLPVKFSAVVYGQWSANDQQLFTSRTSEEITAHDDLSRRFIEHEKMAKLRSESPTNFTYNLK